MKEKLFETPLLYVTFKDLYDYGTSEFRERIDLMDEEEMEEYVFSKRKDIKQKLYQQTVTTLIDISDEETYPRMNKTLSLKETLRAICEPLGVG